jgi:tellurite resistance protein
VLADEARRQLQQLLRSAAAKNIQGKALMAAAVATMAETAVDDSAMPKQEKLVVSNCCTSASELEKLRT